MGRWDRALRWEWVFRAERVSFRSIVWRRGVDGLCSVCVQLFGSESVLSMPAMDLGAIEKHFISFQCEVIYCANS